MNFLTWKRFGKHWFRFAFQDAWGAAFGWATIPAAGLFIIGAKALGIKMPSDATASQVLLNALVAVGLAWVVAFVANIFFFAPRKAWLATHALRIELKNQISMSSLVQSAIDKHSIFVNIRNRSPAHSIYVTLSVAEVKGKDGIALPWQLYSGNIPASDVHQVILAHWFFQKGARENQEILIPSEKSGAFAESNWIKIPQSGSDICLLARSPDFQDQTASCRIWVEQTTKRVHLNAIS